MTYCCFNGGNITVKLVLSGDDVNCDAFARCPDGIYSCVVRIFDSSYIADGPQVWVISGILKLRLVIAFRDCAV